ncbi:MAG: malonyl-CoA decarboxylase [Alphaproteobacteria bacterium]|nr:malonyl-CoA decarboxylase [Alphaproteobacteria bacterium]MCB9929960.1 malonyl-CoA decarboxylase [Alphaproteobacteria bacterium]
MVEIAVQPSLFDRTLEQVRRAVRELANRRGVRVLDLKPDLPDADRERLLQQMRDCLEGKGGEVSARARAANLGRAFMRLNTDGRHRFLTLMADEFNTDPEQVNAAMDAVREATDDRERHAAEVALRDVLRPPRVRLLTQFTGLPEGVKFLVDLRAELMTWARKEPILEELSQDMRRLLSTWFDVGFLEMRRMTWDAPASLLEKLISYEAVHEIQSWDDLKNRLDSDRRCYAFFHPSMPDEPLIFVEIALVSGIAGNVQELLDEEQERLDPQVADTAIFYSISNAQRGLDGISFGDFLIKRVVAALSDEFKNLKTFATLSPIPGFGRWYERELETLGDTILLDDEAKALAEALPEGTEPEAMLHQVLVRSDWAENEALAEALKPVMSRLVATYLYTAKRRGTRTADPVAHFHLSNGARMERLNWLADTSPRGMRQSAGMMINYLYKLDEIDSNHEGYKGEGTIAVSSTIRNLARKTGNS